MQPSPSREYASSATATPASTDLASNVRFPGEDGGHSLAEIARRDLDAALQLLADRAQYITGATGAAIALRRNGKKDMLCRASTGSNAPELGALLSTEFGLSGESVRTRQPLRCDDAERDVRVNREVCRQLGIASVVVMPVVNDDEVLGVFELFSGKVNAFGERDLSAVQRLSEMVETAVRLAEATEKLPERLRMSEMSAPGVGQADPLQDQALNEQVLEDLVLEEVSLEEEEVILEEQEPVLAVTAEESVGKPGLDVAAAEALVEKRITAAEAPRPRTGDLLANAEAAPEPLKEKISTPSTSSGQALSQKPLEDGAPIVGGTVAAAAAPLQATVAENIAVARQASSTSAESLTAPSAETAPAKKSLFWSAARNPAADAARPEEVDRSHVPPVLRSLRKCEACGFPVSAGRVLCVECEEKKWRGQLKVPQSGAPRQVAGPASAVPVAAAPKAEVRTFAAAAQSVAASVPAPSTQRAASAGAVSTAGGGGLAAVKEPKEGTGQLLPAPSAANPPALQTASVPAPKALGNSSADFVLSAGLEPSQSWLLANKYVMGVLLVVVGVVVAVFFLLR